MPIIRCQGPAGEIPASELVGDEALQLDGHALQAWASQLEALPVTERLRFTIAICRGANSITINLSQSLMELDLRDGWDADLPQQTMTEHMAYIQRQPMRWLYTDLQPECEAPLPSLLGQWLPQPRWALWQETTLRATSDLLTLDGTAQERQKREKLLAEMMAKDPNMQRMQTNWQLSADEMTLHRGLLAVFAKAGHPTSAMQLTPAELLEACGWEASEGNYVRLVDALESLTSVKRMSAYKYAPQPKHAKAWKKVNDGTWKRRTTMVRVIQQPLWAKEATQYSVDSSNARVLYYLIRPDGDLLHQVNIQHGGVPKFVQLERADLLPALVEILDGDSRAAARATMLVSAIRASIGERKVDGTGWMRFDYATTAEQLQSLAKATRSAKEPKNEEERLIASLIRLEIAEAGQDYHIAKRLSEELGRPVDRIQAKRYRERLTGLPLRGAPEPWKRNKVIAELQRLLPAIRQMHPGLILNYSLPPKAAGWTLQVDARWRPSE